MRCEVEVRVHLSLEKKVFEFTKQTMTSAVLNINILHFGSDFGSLD